MGENEISTALWVDLSCIRYHAFVDWKFISFERKKKERKRERGGEREIKSDIEREIETEGAIDR